ncbi:LysM peptidoglycan-binding domain-containing protein [Arcanobacterium haemolyticum]|nr:LysM peptidoglycan-binding domain-containing protein [Arcanobacterium haemolyticum]
MSVVEAPRVQVDRRRPRYLPQQSRAARLRVIQGGNSQDAARRAQSAELRAVPTAASVPSAKSAASAASAPSAASADLAGRLRVVKPRVEGNWPAVRYARRPMAPYRRVGEHEVRVDGRAGGMNSAQATARPARAVRSARAVLPATSARLDTVLRVAVSALVVSVLVVVGLVIGSHFVGSAPASLTVQAGDTLWSIAASVPGAPDVATVIEDIQALNGIGADSINVGQVLKLPTY